MHAKICSTSYVLHDDPFLVMVSVGFNLLGAHGKSLVLSSPGSIICTTKESGLLTAQQLWENCKFSYCFMSPPWTQSLDELTSWFTNWSRRQSQLHFIFGEETPVSESDVRIEVSVRFWIIRPVWHDVSTLLIAVKTLKLFVHVFHENELIYCKFSKLLGVRCNSLSFKLNPL